MPRFTCSQWMLRVRFFPFFFVRTSPFSKNIYSAKLHFHEHKFGHKNWRKCGKNRLCVLDNNLWKWLSMVYFYSHIKWMVSISGDEMRIYHRQFSVSRSNCDFASAHQMQYDWSHEYSIVCGWIQTAISSFIIEWFQSLVRYGIKIIYLFGWKLRTID